MRSKNVLSWLVFLGFFGALIGFFLFQKNRAESLRANGKRTMGVIDRSGNNIICRYKVDGQLFEFKRSQPFSGLQDQEMYEVAYDPADPEDVIVVYEHPILPDSVPFFETTSIAVNILWDNKRIFKFTYEFDGKNFERIQKLKYNEKVREDKAYKVRCNSVNPRIAYLIVDAE